MGVVNPERQNPKERAIAKWPKMQDQRGAIHRSSLISGHQGKGAHVRNKTQFTSYAIQISLVLSQKPDTSHFPVVFQARSPKVTMVLYTHIGRYIHITIGKSGLGRGWEVKGWGKGKLRSGEKILPSPGIEPGIFCYLLDA